MEQSQSDRDEHELHFFYWIGRCVKRYQSIEDYLPDIFRKSSKLSDDAADRVFKTGQGLEKKLQLISAIVSELEDERQKDWHSLNGRISRAAASRNQIAHGGPTYGGKAIVILNSDNPSAEPKVIVSGKSHFTLRKNTKSGQAVWTLEQLKNACDEFDILFRNLIAFVRLIDGVDVPKHLLENYP